MTDIIDDLRDLHKQATTENSHFYTAKVISAAMVEISRLRMEKGRCLHALAAITDACEADCGVPTDQDGDDESVGAGGDGKGGIEPMALTFGMLRRARAALT